MCGLPGLPVMPEPREKRDRADRRVPSKAWSSSALATGNAALLKAKKEKDSEEELQKKIQVRVRC